MIVIDPNYVADETIPLTDQQPDSNDILAGYKGT